MTTDQFVRSLRTATREDAIAQVDCWLDACKRCPEDNPTAEQDRPRLIELRTRLQRGDPLAALFG